MGVGLRAGGKVAVGESSATDEGAAVASEGNVEVKMGGGMSVVGTSTTTMQPARPSKKGRSSQGILERGIEDETCRQKLHPSPRFRVLYRLREAAKCLCRINGSCLLRVLDAYRWAAARSTPTTIRRSHATASTSGLSRCPAHQPRPRCIGPSRLVGVK